MPPRTLHEHYDNLDIHDNHTNDIPHDHVDIHKEHIFSTPQSVDFYGLQVEQTCLSIKKLMNGII